MGGGGGRAPHHAPSKSASVLCRIWGGSMKSTNLSLLPLQLGAARMDILATIDQVVMLTDDGQYLQCICEKVLPGVQCQF